MQCSRFPRRRKCGRVVFGGYAKRKPRNKRKEKKKKKKAKKIK
jgi:hypothetical protein